MSTDIELYNKLLEASGSYITNSAIKASAIYGKLGMNFEFFEGTKMQLSPEMCEQAYKDLIFRLVKEKTTISVKYGLMVMIIPIKHDEEEHKVTLSLQLGVMFPDNTVSI